MTWVYLVIRHDDSYTDFRRFEFTVCASKECVKSYIESDARSHAEAIDTEIFDDMYENGLPCHVPTLSNNKLWWEIQEKEVLGAEE